MDFLILGPIEVHNAAGAVALGGSKPRAVLAVLLLNANRPVSAERLALALWGEDAPGGAVKTVQVHVSRLRKALEDPEVITTTPAGYCLRVRDGELDAARFEGLVEDARRGLAAGRPADASTTLREAIALWRGHALADLALEPFARAESARLEEQRLTALELRVEADLAAGRHAEVVGELTQFVADHPMREQLAGQLMLALYRCGRQSDALETYAAARLVLVDEMGIEPGPQLRDLHAAILRQDVALRADTGPVELPPALDPSMSKPLVGREDELAWMLERWDSARTGAGGLVALFGPRGAGKSRLTQELAREVHGAGDAVVHVSGDAPPDTTLGALRRIRAATRPLLLVLDDVDRAAAEVHRELAGLDLGSSPVLVVACARDLLALTHVAADDALELGALDAEAIRTIAARYAPARSPAEVPAEWLLDASGGVPRRVHEVASQWARREAARRVGAVADRAAAGRAELRSMEAELTGGVVDLQETRERMAPPREDDTSPVACPFKGLSAYDVADARYFFGRERLVAELVARLVGASLLGVVGPSGSGKSSVMRAGLLPALAGGVLSGSETWPQALLRPGAHPMRELGAALAELPASGRIVIAVDQFEEAFTVCDDEAERAEFIAELVSAAGDAERYAVVLALRADHYGRCAAYPDLARLLASSNVLVHPMQRQELLRAIERPTEVAGLRIEPELVDALVADVEREPGGLPLMSTALLELWQRRDGRRLRHAVYERMGGVHGAVARLAEQAYGELDPAQQAIARRVLMQLVGSGDGERVERRRVALADLEIDRDEDVARVVALLTDRRLLTVSAGAVELAHEALLREWPRLVDWIEENRDGLRIRRLLSVAARDWDDLQRDEGALYRGARLREVVAWRDARGEPLSELEQRFIATGEATADRDRVTRRRRLVLAFSLLGVAVVALASVAVSSILSGRSTASRELANRSAAVIGSDPGRALAIALDAVKRRDTAEAERAVRQATLEDRATGVVRVAEQNVFRGAPTIDGSRLLTVAEDGRVRVTSLEGKRPPLTIDLHKDPDGNSGAFDVVPSPDGTHVASVGLDGTVSVVGLDGEARSVVLRLPKDIYQHYGRTVEFGPGGRTLLVAAEDGTVRLVGADGSHPRTLARHPTVRVARFDPTGRRFLSAGQDGLARIWDLAGRGLASLRHGGIVNDARWSPDGRRVATAGDDGVVRIWDANSGILIRTLRLALSPLYSLRFSPHGTRIVAGAGDGAVIVSDVRGGPPLAALRGHDDIVYDVGFVGDDRHLYSVGADGTLRTWALPKIATLPVAKDDYAYAPSFDAAGELVVSGFGLGPPRIWDPASRRVRRLPGRADTSAGVFSGDGKHVLITSGADPADPADPADLLYDVARHSSSVIPATKAATYAAAIDQSGGRIALAKKRERVVVEAPDGSRRVLLAAHRQVNGVGFSPDAKHVVTASEDGAVRTWNALTGARENVFRGGAAALRQVAYSPDGKSLAAAGADGVIRIWRVAGGAPTLLYGHAGSVNSVAFDADGNRLVSGGKDGKVLVWDVAGGDPLVVLHQHVGEVTGVAFNPKDGSVVSGADDGIRVSACEVCGSFASVRALAATRLRVPGDG